MGAKASILILGLGNALMSDDGVGVHAAKMLSADEWPAGVVCRDGGALGLALLPEIQDAAALILIDAARFGGKPGEVRVFEGDAFDERIRSSSSSVHEIAVSELIDAARLIDGLPTRRALVGVEPQNVDWGCALTSPVADAAPAIRHAVGDVAERWLFASRTPEVLEEVP